MTDITGKASWWELQVTDLAEAQQFYAAVFGFTYTPYGDEYAVALNSEGEMVGGLTTTTAGDPGGRGVRLYFGTEELEAVLDRVRAAAGTVVQERTEIGGEMGYYATVADPSGVRIGLSTMKPAE